MLHTFRFSLSLPPPEKKRRKKLFFVQKAKFTFRLESRIGVETPQTELMIAVHKKEMFNRIGDLEMLKFFPFSSSSGTPDMALSNHNRLIRFVALFQTEKNPQKCLLCMLLTARLDFSFVLCLTRLPLTPLSSLLLSSSSLTPLSIFQLD